MAITQADMAEMYADLIISGNKNWSGINATIKSMWSTSGLIRVKKLAWKIVKGRTHER